MFSKYSGLVMGYAKFDKSIKLDTPFCPECQSEAIINLGMERGHGEAWINYVCKECECKFTDYELAPLHCSTYPWCAPCQPEEMWENYYPKFLDSILDMYINSQRTYYRG